MGLTGRVRRWLVVALLVYVVLLAIALLAPTSGTQSEMASWLRDLGLSLGFTEQIATQGRAEFLCNALILMPASALASLLWPRTTWRDWTAYTFVAAALVELTQGLFLPGRTASQSDVVANTLGGLAGALVVDVAWLILRRTAAGTPRSPQAAPRPDPDRLS
jgi:glycopeptide antibiotics resistance protein